MSLVAHPLITEISDRNHFLELLKHDNPGLIIVKFGADWCKPCKLIESSVLNYFERMPSNVQCVILDIDESFDIYAYLKSKKMVNGIPAILCYKKGNVGFVPNDIVTGTDKTNLHLFFERCISLLQ
jgi:thiol:disulfide interchange protein